jgi:hypothetical protein
VVFRIGHKEYVKRESSFVKRKDRKGYCLQLTLNG